MGGCHFVCVNLYLSVLSKEDESCRVGPQYMI